MWAELDWEKVWLGFEWYAELESERQLEFDVEQHAELGSEHHSGPVAEPVVEGHAELAVEVDVEEHAELEPEHHSGSAVELVVKTVAESVVSEPVVDLASGSFAGPVA